MYHSQQLVIDIARVHGTAMTSGGTWFIAQQKDVFYAIGDVAQLGERVLCKHEVASSTLVISTMNHSQKFYVKFLLGLRPVLDE